MLWARISIRARCTTLCDKVCQWLATGRLFSPGTSASSINKTDLHDITEILLKVALITIKQTNKQTLKRYIEYLLSAFFCAKDTSFPLQGNITAATNTNKSKTFIFFIIRFRMSLSIQSRQIYTIEFTSVPRIHSQKQVKPTNIYYVRLFWHKNYNF